LKTHLKGKTAFGFPVFGMFSTGFIEKSFWIASPIYKVKNSNKEEIRYRELKVDFHT
jgi:hypothetical protein